MGDDYASLFIISRGVRRDFSARRTVPLALSRPPLIIPPPATIRAFVNFTSSSHSISYIHGGKSGGANFWHKRGAYQGGCDVIIYQGVRRHYISGGATPCTADKDKPSAYGDPLITPANIFNVEGILDNPPAVLNTKIARVSAVPQTSIS